MATAQTLYMPRDVQQAYKKETRSSMMENPAKITGKIMHVIILL